MNNCRATIASQRVAAQEAKCKIMLDAAGIRPTVGDPDRQFAMSKCLESGAEGVAAAAKIERMLR